MVGVSTIVVNAVKFGYDRYGPRGAVAAAVALGASYVVIRKVVPIFADISEERIEELHTRATEDELADMLGEAFAERFGDRADAL
ncbi:hypothetical protein [Halobacterium sp. R2-5]|uniref:hypothetical protein n=1 Tax=Halobacterium sp. R2-5 TaxID=2715751 RepID=UPI0014231D25|nr:hypothetical protein [Halobacterium sp. R2-5]NIB99891.1 hypothetical protein [Halobacterium sp. R2-5]